jgi:hypothetical protein
LKINLALHAAKLEFSGFNPPIYFAASEPKNLGFDAAK